MSKTKMEIGKTTIEFMGLRSDAGCISVHDHIIQNLQKFQDRLLTKLSCKDFLALCIIYICFIQDTHKI